MGNPLAWTINRVRHAFCTPTAAAASKKNIHAHYDLGNAFYARWLDPTHDLLVGQVRAAGPAARRGPAHQVRARWPQSMGLQAGQSVLEIGCGWGGFAEFAAARGRRQGHRHHHLARSSTTSPSSACSSTGLAERADIRLIDYRDVEGRFDRVASIEMFEAVGERYWPAYFGKIHEALAPGGRAGLQIITIRDELFEDYRSRADFIQKYIFPGGMLPSRGAPAPGDRQAPASPGAAIARFGQRLRRDPAPMGTSASTPPGATSAPLGFDERFRKLWQFYLSYCEAGFRTERTNVVQLSLAKV